MSCEVVSAGECVRHNASLPGRGHGLRRLFWSAEADPDGPGHQSGVHPLLVRTGGSVCPLQTDSSPRTRACYTYLCCSSVICKSPVYCIPWWHISVLITAYHCIFFLLALTKSTNGAWETVSRTKLPNNFTSSKVNRVFQILTTSFCAKYKLTQSVTLKQNNCLETFPTSTQSTPKVRIYHVYSL